MKPSTDRAHSAESQPAPAPAPKRRFHIQKLEERIAPKKGGKGTNNCGGGSGTSGGTIGGCVSVY